MASVFHRHGWNSSELTAVKAATAAADELNAHQITAKVALAVLSMNGLGETKQAAVLHHLSQSEYGPDTDILMRPVYDVFAHAKVASAAELAAGTVGRVFTSGNNLLSQAMSGSNSAIAAALMLAMAGGSGLGALNWHLGRMATDDDDDNAQLAAQTRLLRRTNREQEQRLAPTPALA